MAKCQTCKTFILWGGVKKDGRRYCNSGCMDQDTLGRVGDRIPDNVVKKEAQKIMRGPCPACNLTTNDVELRFTHRAVSYLVMTIWSKNSILSCRSCHRKKVMSESLITLFLGWWGFPFGLIVTPIQLLRNISAASSSNSPTTEPSSDTCSFVRGILAQAIIENSPQQVSPENRIKNTRKKGTLKSNLAPPIPRREVNSKAQPIEPGR